MRAPMKHRSKTNAALAAALSCVFASAPSAARDITVQGAHGRTLTITDSSRTVSIGGAITEIMVALGVGSKLVGIDSTSTFPPDAVKGKANVGYLRQLSAEGVIGLRPTLIVAMDSAGPKQAVQAFEAAQIPLLQVPEDFSEKGLLDKISLIGRAMDAEAAASCLSRAVAQDFDYLRQLRSKVTKPVRVMFVMSLVNGQAMAAGNNTAANEIIALSGGVNAITDYDGYKTINNEAIVAAKPDVVLTIKRDKDSFESAAFFAHPAFALTPAGANKAFISMDGLYLLGFGPRTPTAAREVATKLYPQLAAPSVPSHALRAEQECRP